MFLTVEDFEVYPFSLPNLIEDEESFLAFVDEAEENILRDLLGTKMYNAFVSGLFNNGVAIPEVDIEQRWKDLRDGVDYAVEGELYHYSGMKKLLRGYVTTLWLQRDVVHASGVGGIIPDTENSTVVGPMLQSVAAYNKFVKVAGSFSKQCHTLFGYIYNSGNVYNDVSTNIKEYILTAFKAPTFRNRFNLKG